MDEMDEILQNGSLSSLVHIIFSILKHIIIIKAYYVLYGKVLGYFTC